MQTYKVSDVCRMCVKQAHNGGNCRGHKDNLKGLTTKISCFERKEIDNSCGYCKRLNDTCFGSLIPDKEKFCPRFIARVECDMCTKMKETGFGMTCTDSRTCVEHEHFVSKAILKQAQTIPRKQPQRPTQDEYYLGVALAVSRKSTCLKRHYGAIIVKDDFIVSTGYNGSPRGEVNCIDINKCKRENAAPGKDYDKCPAVHAEQNAIISADGHKMIGATMYLCCEEVKNMCEYVGDPEHCSGECGEWCTGCELKLVMVDNPVPCVHCLRMIKNARITRVVTVAGELDLIDMERG